MNKYSVPDTELHIKRGRIYDRGKPGDDRLQIRILPDMADLNTNRDKENFPWYSSLTPSMVFNGKTELEVGTNAEEVIVVTSSDYTYGYILCKASFFFGITKSSTKTDSFGFEDINKYVNIIGLGSLDYKNLSVQNIVNGDSWGLIEFCDISTGSKYILNSAGNCIILKDNTIYLRTGTPSSMTQSGVDNPHSSITLSGDTVKIEAVNFIVDADKISLGKTGANILATHSYLPNAIKGMDLQPVTNITV